MLLSVAAAESAAFPVGGTGAQNSVLLWQLSKFNVFRAGNVTVLTFNMDR